MVAGRGRTMAAILPHRRGTVCGDASPAIQCGRTRRGTAAPEMTAQLAGPVDTTLARPPNEPAGRLRPGAPGSGYRARCTLWLPPAAVAHSVMGGMKLLVVRAK